jgi:hypothetical protein
MTTCTICFSEHDHRWYDKPSMYCEACAKLKEDGLGKCQEIVPGLYLGDYESAKKFVGITLCVHEDDEFAVEYHIPILEKKPKSHMDRTGALVSMAKLNTAVQFIRYLVRDGIEYGPENILVHCKGGVERSPLVVAHHLVESLWFADLDKAYAHIKKIRPVVSERKFWLP